MHLNFCEYAPKLPSVLILFLQWLWFHTATIMSVRTLNDISWALSFVVEKGVQCGTGNKSLSIGTQSVSKCLPEIGILIYNCIGKWDSKAKRSFLLPELTVLWVTSQLSRNLTLPWKTMWDLGCSSGCITVTANHLVLFDIFQST
jgi:hypothetical protein